MTARLLANTAIAAVIGSAFAWGSLPEGEDHPSIIARLIDGGREYTHDDVVTLRYTRTQFDVRGWTYGEAKALYRLLIAELELPNDEYDVTFEEGMVIFERDAEPEKMEGRPDVFRAIVDFLIPVRIDLQQGA